jgi:predicted nucleotidyltransferase
LLEAWAAGKREYARAVAPSLATTSLSADERRFLVRLARALQRELHATSVWLYGSRARGEPPHSDSDIDVLVIAPGSSWDNLGRAYRLLHRLAVEAGVDPMLFSVQVFDPEWLAGRRAIDSFFIQEVDRDKVPLAGQP